VHAHGAPATTAGAAANEDHHEEIRDVNPYEWVAWAPLLSAIVFFGVYPQALFKVFDPAVRVISAKFGG